jgi:hypothetical protein
MKHTPLTLIASASILGLALTGCSAEDLEAYQAEQNGEQTEAELIEVPDLIGENLADAEDQLKDLDLDVDEYDVSEDESSVWRSSNWEVTEQDPAAETEVEPDTEIRLGAQKIEDEEDNEDAEEDEAESDNTDMPEPETPEHAVALATGDPEATAGIEPGETGDIIFITFNIQDLGTNNMITNGAKNSTLDALQALAESDLDYHRIFLQGHFPMEDEYGNIEDSMILNAGYDQSTVEQINFDNINPDNIFDLRDAGMVHPELGG